MQADRKSRGWRGQQRPLRPCEGLHCHQYHGNEQPIQIEQANDPPG